MNHKDRVAVLGDNGSGKTTFVRELSYKDSNLLKGEISYGKHYSTQFIDQKYDLVERDLSLLENINKYQEEISYEEARRILGNLEFPMDYDIYRKAKNLSGGETARLAFAIATGSEIDLLILDEPTNNLDIQTLDVVVEALNNYQGTLVVISHDVSFLRRIKIQSVYEIQNRALIGKSLEQFAL